MKLIEDAITDYYGDRCPDFAEGCPCCEAWAEYDKFVGLENQLAAARKALEIMVQEYDKVDLSHDEPPSMTSAVLEARALLEA